MSANEEFISEIRRLEESSDIEELLKKAEGGQLQPLFAAVSLAAKKGLGQAPFDEQLLAARALIEGKIIEMQTGEGKTLSAVFAAAWHKSCGRRVHILTFNDYLAQRDCNWMKPVYELLGMTCGAVKEKTDLNERKQAYKADVLYISARECGFDYLRDFTVQTEEETVGQGFFAAIVDEADSLLIDEGRLPLVVASDVSVKQDRELSKASQLVAGLSEEDYGISLEADSVYLTDSGAEKAEAYFETENLYDSENTELLSKINDCLKARLLLQEDKDYINRDGKIRLIDKFTGRVAENRHYPGTLQTAVELKHGLETSSRGVVMGSIALQYFVRNYSFLSAMTGTAEASKEEFYQLYDLKLEKIPPHLPSVRIDRETEIYSNTDLKHRAVVKAVCEAHEKGQPVLVGTGSIADSEALHELLKKQGVESSVLNAKNDFTEAEIISNAGAPFAVTISTNMAGRGVDIKLGGADESRRQEAVNAGGLLVISTFMPESSRLVRQLIGRAGRQGDPGESRCFVALDEPIMEKYKLNSLVPLKHRHENADGAIEDKVLRREVERIQRICEGDNFDTRARLLKFTMIGEKHRDQVFEARKRFLQGSSPEMWKQAENYEEAVKRFGRETVDALERKTAVAAVNRFWSEYLEYTEYLRQGIHLTAVGGKSPAEEYNIAVEEYYQGIEEELKLYMQERFDCLLKNGTEGYEIETPKNIRTYLLEDTGDELNKKPFLVNFLSDETERELEEAAKKNTPSVLDEPVQENKKKGFFGRLFKN